MLPASRCAILNATLAGSAFSPSPRTRSSTSARDLAPFGSILLRSRGAFSRGRQPFLSRSLAARPLGLAGLAGRRTLRVARRSDASRRRDRDPRHGSRPISEVARTPASAAPFFAAPRRPPEVRRRAAGPPATRFLAALSGLAIAGFLLAKAVSARVVASRFPPESGGRNGLRRRPAKINGIVRSTLYAGKPSGYTSFGWFVSGLEARRLSVVIRSEKSPLDFRSYLPGRRAGLLFSSVRSCARSDQGSVCLQESSYG